MTDPTEALFCVKPDGHSGPHAGWIGGEWSVRDNWTDLRHPPIEQASVRPADPAEAADAAAEAAYQDSQNTDPQYRPSAAVAPYEHPHVWEVQEVCEGCGDRRAVAPSSAEVGGSLDVEALAAEWEEQARVIEESVTGTRPMRGMAAETLRACARDLRAAYADAIRKRGEA